MSIERREGIAALAEVVAVLARYPGLRCSPIVDHEDGVLALTINIVANQSLQTLSLADELKYVADVAQVRRICATYGIKPAQLEQALQGVLRDDATPHIVRHLTAPEIDAVVAVLTEQTGPSDPPTDNDKLLDAAVVKLVDLGRALSGAL